MQRKRPTFVCRASECQKLKALLLRRGTYLCVCVCVNVCVLLTYICIYVGKRTHTFPHMRNERTTRRFITYTTRSVLEGTGYTYIHTHVHVCVRVYSHTFSHAGTTTTSTRVNALTFIVHYTTSTAWRQIRFAFVDVFMCVPLPSFSLSIACVGALSVSMCVVGIFHFALCILYNIQFNTRTHTIKHTKCSNV